MSTIIINRSSESENRLRLIKIFVNDKLVSTIANGKTLTIDTPPGTYKVQAKIDWCTSNLIEIDLKKEEEKILHLSSGSGTALIRIFFKPKNYLSLTEKQ